MVEEDRTWVGLWGGGEDQLSTPASLYSVVCIAVFPVPPPCTATSGWKLGNEAMEVRRMVVPFCTQGRMARMETTTLRMSVELMYSLFSVQLAS